jgi:hypothetical protein
MSKIFLANAGVGSRYNPLKVSGCQGWWDFSLSSSITQSNQLVSQINDLSGNTRHLTQGTDANKFILTTAATLENMLYQSGAINASPWANTGGVISMTASTFTPAAANDGRAQTVPTLAGVTYRLSAIVASAGNTNLTFVTTNSATGNTQAQTVTSTPTRYTITTLGRTGSGLVTFGLQDTNAAGFGVVTFQDVIVQTNAAPTTYTATTTSPAYAGINSKTCGWCNGTSAAMQSGNVTLAQPMSIVAAIRPHVATGNKYYFGGGAVEAYNSDTQAIVGAGSYIAGAAASGTVEILTNTLSGGTGYIYRNGTQIQTGAVGAGGLVAQPFQAGSGAATFFPGYICEVFVFNKVLSASEQTYIENHLRNKWGTA